MRKPWVVDLITGFDQFGVRPYDPSAGRFQSQDPLSFSAGDTDLYRYVFNAPTNAIDPSGLEDTGLLGPPPIRLGTLVYFDGNYYIAPPGTSTGLPHAPILLGPRPEPSPSQGYTLAPPNRPGNLGGIQPVDYRPVSEEKPPSVYLGPPQHLPPAPTRRLTPTEIQDIIDLGFPPPGYRQPNPYIPGGYQALPPPRGGGRITTLGGDDGPPSLQGDVPTGNSGKVVGVGVGRKKRAVMGTAIIQGQPYPLGPGRGYGPPTNYIGPGAGFNR